MKATAEKLGYALACAAALAVGSFLGSDRSPAAPPVQAPGAPPASTQPGAAPASKGSMHSAQATDARSILLRRTLAACETAALWQWLEQGDREPGFVDHNLRYSVVVELVDRLGWGAWQRAQTIAEPALRELLGDFVLTELARRDPWKAFAEWQQHRDIFQRKAAGTGVISECILAAADISADKVIEMFQQIPLKDSEEMMTVAFAKDFDFRKVLDHLAAAEKQPYTAIESLVPAWAERSPVEAAQWLASHPEYLEREYRGGEISGTLRAIASAEIDEASRRKALEALATLKPEALDQAWSLIGDGSKGKLSASILQSADITGRRGEYLRSALEETRSTGTIDPSWEQVPLAERQQVLSTIEQEWAQREPLPVDAKARARWVAMVKTAWKLAP